MPSSIPFRGQGLSRPCTTPVHLRAGDAALIIDGFPESLRDDSVVD